jgi:hypothetical protein
VGAVRELWPGSASTELVLSDSCTSEGRVLGLWLIFPSAELLTTVPVFYACL